MSTHPSSFNRNTLVPAPTRATGSTKPAKTFPCTDAGNAELFASLYGDKVRFDHKRDRWLTWDAKRSRWEEDKTHRMSGMMKRAARRRSEGASQTKDRDAAKRKQQFSWALQSENRYRIDAALELAKSENPISDDGDRWDGDSWLFGAQNGVVDLRTGGFRPATQKDAITKFSRVRFDRDAKCPRFEKFLQEIFGTDTEMLEYLGKAVGYSLTGSTKEQCLFACYGEGSNGKSTLLEIILYIMGDYGIDLPFSVLEAKQYSSTPGEGVNLPGARFAKAVEVRKGRRLDEARVKSWTGGDTITVRPLYRNSFSFQPTHKLWLAFNDKPEISDDSNAMWRRVRLIPFTRTFDHEKADKGLLEELKREASGILNWAISGCLAWQRNGLKTPTVVKDATREYEAESDPLALFFEDCCEMNASFRLTKGALWTAYQNWCRANKETPCSRKVFADKMKRRDFGETSDGKARFWTGLRLNTDATDATGASS